MIDGNATSSAEGPAFRLRPDAAVVSMNNAVERLLDAIWKHLDPGAVGCGVAREDAYQLAAYAGAYRCSSVALVYPKPPGLSAELVEIFELPLPESPRIEVYVLDLLGAAGRQPLPRGLVPWDMIEVSGGSQSKPKSSGPFHNPHPDHNVV